MCVWSDVCKKSVFVELQSESVLTCFWTCIFYKFYSLSVTYVNSLPRRICTVQCTRYSVCTVQCTRYSVPGTVYLMYQVALCAHVKIYLVQKSIKNFVKLPEFVKEEQRKKKKIYKLARACVCIMCKKSSPTNKRPSEVLPLIFRYCFKSLQKK